MRDLHHNIKVTNVIDPAAIKSGNAATAGAVIDTQGYESLEFLIEAGVLTDGTLTPSLTEGELADGSDGTAVPANDLLGTIAGATFAATDDSKTKTIGYRGGHRYVKLTVTQAGATTGGFYNAVAVQSHARNQPGNVSPAPVP